MAETGRDVRDARRSAHNPATTSTQDDEDPRVPSACQNEAVIGDIDRLPGTEPTEADQGNGTWLQP